MYKKIISRTRVINTFLAEIDINRAMIGDVDTTDYREKELEVMSQR